MQGECRNSSLLEGFCRAAAYLREAKIVQGEWNERIKQLFFEREWSILEQESHEMNGLNESNVTKVTCVTNVTNEFDETRFLSFLQSDSAASKAHFILSKRRRRRYNRIQRILLRCCVRQTIRVNLKANAYCSVLPVSEHVRGPSSQT